MLLLDLENWQKAFVPNFFKTFQFIGENELNNRFIDNDNNY